MIKICLKERLTDFIWLLWATQKERVVRIHVCAYNIHASAHIQRLRLDCAGVQAEMNFC